MASPRELTQEQEADILRLGKALEAHWVDVDSVIDAILSDVRNG